MASPETLKNQKERIGVVVSDKMTKTIVVQVRDKMRHPEYGKVMKTAKKFKVHDEKNTAKIGDRVRIVETRPLSKDKRWRLVEILGHADTSSDTDIKEVEAVSPVKAPKKTAPAAEKAGQT